MSRRPALRAAAWLLGWLTVAWLGAALYRWSLPDHVVSGRCEGIGFGCVPSPRDGMTLVMAIVGLPITAACLIVGTGWIVAWRRRWPAWVVGTTAFAVSVLVALLVLTLVGALNW